jgi:hypothetical protein
MGASFGLRLVCDSPDRNLWEAPATQSNCGHIQSAFNFPWRAVAVYLAAFGQRGLFIPEASLARPCRHRAAGFFDGLVLCFHGLNHRFFCLVEPHKRSQQGC